MAPVICEGGCHCGAVRFRIELDAGERELLDCNCSICTKKGCFAAIDLIFGT